MDPPCTPSTRRPYVFHPDTHALSVVSNSVLITVNQEDPGVYLHSFNLITGYNTNRHYVSMAAMDLIPPLGLVNLPQNRVQLTFYAKECEKSEIFKFVYVLRAGWDVDISTSSIEKQKLTVPMDCKVLCVHNFADDAHPSIVAASNDRMFRLVLAISSLFDLRWQTLTRVELDPDMDNHHRQIDMYRAGFNDDRKLCAAVCKGSDFVVVDDKLSKFFRRQGADFNAPTISHLAKKAVTMQVVCNRGQFYVAVDREKLYVVNERACRFMKIPLPEGRVMGSGLVFDAFDDLITTDMEGRNPAPFRFPSRGIPSLQTISCLKVVSMAPEETLFDSRKVDSTDEFVRVLFMAKDQRVAYSTRLPFTPSADKSPPSHYSPLYSYGTDTS